MENKKEEMEIIDFDKMEEEKKEKNIYSYVDDVLNSRFFKKDEKKLKNLNTNNTLKKLWYNGPLKPILFFVFYIFFFTFIIIALRGNKTEVKENIKNNYEYVFNFTTSKSNDTIVGKRYHDKYLFTINNTTYFQEKTTLYRVKNKNLVKANTNIGIDINLFHMDNMQKIIENSELLTSRKENNRLIETYQTDIKEFLINENSNTQITYTVYKKEDTITGISFNKIGKFNSISISYLNAKTITEDDVSYKKR